MELKKRPKLVKDFWPRLQRSALWIIGAMQLGLTVIIAFVLVLLGFHESHTIGFVITLVLFFGGGFLVQLAAFTFIGGPMKDLLAVVTHISGERTNETPPNPNDKKYENSGFKDVLQTLYELGSAKGAEPAAPAPSTDASLATVSVPSVQSSQNALQAALDETVCGFVVLDHKRNISFSNKSAPTKVNQDGSSSLDLLFPERDSLTQWLDECEKSAVKTERSWSRIPDKLPDQEDRRFFDVFASYDKGAASETVITLIDRTNLYKVGEQELDFIAFAAHELRGPITVIRGYLDVLQDELSGTLQEDQVELFHRLTVSANRLTGYINNILNTSKYDRRHLQLHLVESSVAKVYDTIADDMQLRAKAQNRLVAVTIPPDLPTIPADTASLSEVFANLIDNAIKYSNEGGAINVIASKKGDFVEIAVEDHGIGMPGNVMSNLFQKFYRSHRSRETVAGTGIGLYISKAIVESHGGTISVKSEDGKGSTFTVSLPTYATVADKLVPGNNNTGLIESHEGWIKNHAMYRG
jgi:signal transduction histidine kinase